MPTSRDLAIIVSVFFSAVLAVLGGVVVAGVAAACDPVVTETPGCGKGRPFDAAFTHPRDVDVNGTPRTYGVHLPDTYDGRSALPVVLVFHGDAECIDFDDVENVCRAAAPSTVEGTRESFGLEAALGEDAIVVYVDGNNENVFRPDLLSWDTFRLPGDNPDFAAVDAVLDDVKNTLCVDDDRVFAAGFSGGAFFAHSLGCLKGGITAIAAFEGGFEAGEVAVSFDEGNVVDVDACVGDVPGALVVQADDDTVVPPRYGEAAAATWAARNGCGDDVDDAAVSDGIAGAGVCAAFSGCQERVVLCTPASADPPRTHAIWSPQGPAVAAAFFRRFL